jgi:RNA polymerase sigma-70 factor (ECF subfamily)
MPNQLVPALERDMLEKAQQAPVAFKELYGHYFSRVYAYIGYRIGQVQDVEDVVADTFLSAVEKLNEFEWRGDGSFAAWLFRIASNQVSSYYRKNNKVKESVPLESLPQIKSNAMLPDDSSLQKEKFAKLRQMVGTLSPRRQEIIIFKFFGGLRNNEIAKILGLDERTIASHLCRGLEDLHGKYQNEVRQTEKEEAHEYSRQIDSTTT